MTAMLARSYRLRPIDAAECELTMRWRDEPTVRAAMPRRDPVDPDYHRRWWPGALADPRRRMMMLEENRDPVAIIVFMDVEPGVSSRWGYYTAPHRQITATRARAAWIACECYGLAYAFHHLRLQTLHCEVLQSNEAVLRLHARAGFQFHGLRPSGDERRDFVQLMLARDDWRKDWAERFFGEDYALRIVPNLLDM
jgi:UDP-4-amino-4,6-dideoxy-N-acetyl-beta-L-altrosamine N-acetyltransferase